MFYDLIIFAKVRKIVHSSKFKVHNFVICAKICTFVHRNGSNGGFLQLNKWQNSQSERR